MEKILVQVLLSIVCYCVLRPTHAQKCNDKYQISTTALNYTLEWSLEESVINFTVTVQIINDEILLDGVLVWIGLGFSNKTKKPFMIPADMIIARFFMPINETEFEIFSSSIQDMYTAVGHSEPLQDEISNIMDSKASYIDGVYSMSFTRPLVTGDRAHDVTLDVPRYWIWAVGPLDEDGELEEHTERGNVTKSPISLPSVNDCSSAVKSCSTESTNDEAGTITWPESAIGTTVYRPCPFGPPNTNASRTCMPNSDWTTPETRSCATIVTRRLQSLQNDTNMINVSNAAQFTRNLSNFIDEAGSSTIDQTEENALIVSLVLLTVWELFQNTSENIPLSIRLEVIEEVLSILDDIEEWPIASIKDQGPIIVRVLERFAQFLTSQENLTNLTLTTENITFFGNRVNADSLEENGKSFSINQAASGPVEINPGNNSVSHFQDEQPAAIFSFPSGVNIQELVGMNELDVGLFVIAYDNNDLFFDSTRDGVNGSEDVGSDVVVGFDIAELPDGTPLPVPVSITLRIADPVTGSTENISNATCVFYNFTTLQWDSTGCETIYDPDNNPSNVTCICSHLTNFACLVSIGDRISPNGGPSFTRAQEVTLEVFTFIGIVLSLIGLLATFISLIAFKKIRKHDVTKFHLQLCVALACMYLVFVCGIGSTDNRGGCVTVGTMIQYFTLVAWMWMGAEALLMFQHLIFVFVETTWKYILLVSIACWSIPLVFVVIPVSIDPDYYITTFDNNSNRTAFCFISDIGVFFGAFLGPILLVIIFNTFVFTVFLYVLFKHRLRRNKYKLDKLSMTPVEMLKAVLSICGVMVLFGFSWILVIFTFITTNQDVAFAFEIIFVFFNAFQGLWMFLFFVVVNKETRNSWRKFFSHNCRKKSSYKVLNLRTTASSTVSDSIHSNTASLMILRVTDTQSMAETPLTEEESVDRSNTDEDKKVTSATVTDVDSTNVYSTAASVIISEIFEQLDIEKLLITDKDDTVTSSHEDKESKFSSEDYERVYCAVASLLVSRAFKELDIEMTNSLTQDEEVKI